MNNLTPPPGRIASWLTRLRLPVISLTLALVLYYTVMVVLLPHPGFDFETLPTGEIVVHDPRPGSPAATVLHDQDVIVAVEGWPTRQSVDWHWLFPMQSQYTYTIERDSQTYTVTLPIIPNTVDVLASRFAPHVVALTAWLVGALVLLFATSRNRDAWRVGFTLLGIGVAVAAASGTVYFAPGAQFGYHVFTPMLTAAFVELGFLPSAVALNRVERTLLRLVYGVAIGLSIASLMEQLVFYPRGTRLSFGDLSLAQTRLLFIAACLLANPIITAVRYWRAPRSHLKQQLRVLLSCSLIAVLPLIVVVLVPTALNLGTEVLFGAFSYELPVWCLVLIPAAYGYVIYRHRYLNLDIFMTQTLAIMLVGLLLLTLHAFFAAALQSLAGLKSLEPLPSVTFVMFSGVLVPLVNKSSVRFTERLLYGHQAPDQQVLANLARALADNPDVGSLSAALQNVLDYLQVRQAALWLADSNGDYLCVHAWRTVADSFPSGEAAQIVPKELVTRASVQSGHEPPPPLLELYPWIEALAPVCVTGKVAGLLALGPRVPDESFTVYQLAFVRQACDAIGVAAHAIQLFEASRTMSRKLLQIQNDERTRLAAQIHDDPLQRLSYVANTLGQVVGQVESLAPDAAHVTLECQTTLRSVAAHLRSICAGLRPPVLDAGLAYVIKEAAYNFEARNPTKVHAQVDLPKGVPIPADTKIAIYQVLTEALHNAQKHARASNVWIALNREQTGLHFSVIDDGRGAQLDEMSLADLVRAGHFGIVGMHEWASFINGQLSVTQRSGGGTIITLIC